MHDLIDLARYPLNQPDSPAYTAMVAKARADLARDGMFNIEGFLRPDALKQAVAEVKPVLARDAFVHKRHHNIYFRREVPGLPADHPALREVETVNNTICGDQMEGMVLRRLYEAPEFARFLADTMEKPQLYRMDDPLAGVNAIAYNDGQGLNWHFDRSEFTTTLLLQAPDEGSVFEYRSDLRSETDPNYDGVALLLRGQDEKQRAQILAPGTLNVFRGKNTAHRVTPAKGPRARIVAVLTFFETPGKRFTPEEQLGFYGRTG